MKRNRFPKGWNETRVRRLIGRYEGQSESEEIAEDEAAVEGKTIVEVPKEILPEIRSLISKYRLAHG